MTGPITTVEDLIEHLKDMPPKAVIIVHDATGTWTHHVHLTLTVDGEVLIDN